MRYRTRFVHRASSRPEYDRDPTLAAIPTSARDFTRILKNARLLTTDARVIEYRVEGDGRVVAILGRGTYHAIILEPITEPQEVKGP